MKLVYRLGRDDELYLVCLLVALNSVHSAAVVVVSRKVAARRRGGFVTILWCRRVGVGDPRRGGRMARWRFGRRGSR